MKYNIYTLKLEPVSFRTFIESIFDFLTTYMGEPGIVELMQEVPSSEYKDAIRMFDIATDPNDGYIHAIYREDLEGNVIDGFYFNENGNLENFE